VVRALLDEHLAAGLAVIAQPVDVALAPAWTVAEHVELAG
jgi:hypothetical protein